MIKIKLETLDGYESFTRYKKWTFPSGELGVELLDLKDTTEYSKVTIDAEISISDEIIELALVTAAVKNSFPNLLVKELFLPYIPFGRQDRVTSTGTSFSLKVFADIINSCGFTKVITVTPHSNVSQFLINNLECKEFYEVSDLFSMVLVEIDSDNPPILIAPDAGAEKRVYNVAKAFGIKDVFVCSKRRDPATGNIIGYSVPNDIPENRDLIILDDICDGGNSFIELAKYLPKNRKSLTLFVTHGIFSKGRQVLYDAGYDKVESVFNFLEKK